MIFRLEETYLRDHSLKRIFRLVCSTSILFFRVAVDQVDSLRRQILLKDEEVKRLRKHCDHEEVEKIKIVQKLAQVEEEIDQKTFYVRNLNSQLSNKADTLEALRIAKRDIGNTYR